MCIRSISRTPTCSGTSFLFDPRQHIKWCFCFLTEGRLTATDTWTATEVTPSNLSTKMVKLFTQSSTWRYKWQTPPLPLPLSSLLSILIFPPFMHVSFTHVVEAESKKDFLNLQLMSMCLGIFQTDQGIKNLAPTEAGRLEGADPDYAQRDLFNSIESGKFPSWSMFIQVMTFDEAENWKFNPFDLTKVCCACDLFTCYR